MLSKLQINLPFSFYEKNKIVFPSARMVESYVHALEVELDNNPLEQSFDVLNFDGTISTLAQEQFDNLVKKIKKHYDLNQAESFINIFPGALSLIDVSNYINLKINYICFDVPTFIDEEIRNYELPNLHSAIDQTVYMFETYQLKNYGIRTLSHVPGRDEQRYLKIAMEIIRNDPEFVEFIPFMEIEDPCFKTLKEKLISVGYKCYDERIFYKHEIPKVYLPSEAIYSFGLNARSIADGFETITTNDFNLYLKSSAFFDKIVVSSKEL